MLIESLTIGPFAMNCYIIASEETRSAAVIDPGGEVDTILSIAKNGGLTIEKIINTHGHIDHVAGIKELQDRLGVPFFMHEGDEVFLKAIPESAAEYGLKTLGIPRVDGYLDEGDIVKVDTISLKIIHTPGHSPGGICFLAEKEIFVGDTLFAGSIGRTDLPGGNYERLLYSIETKLLTLDESITAYCGHGPSTTIGKEKQTNPFLAFS